MGKTHLLPLGGVSLALTLSCSGTREALLAPDVRADNVREPSDGGIEAGGVEVPPDAGVAVGSVEVHPDAGVAAGDSATAERSGMTCQPIEAEMSALDREARFWEAFEIDAEWVEFFPTLTEMAIGSDIAALGHVTGIVAGTPVSSAPEDIVADAILTVQVDEVIRGDERPTLTLSLVYNLPSEDAEALIEAIGALGCSLPSESLLLLLRRRADRDDEYRVVNGYGLWARTRRAAVDAPLNPERPSEGFFSDEVSGFSSVSDLADSLRP
jgi:hypothetical protein